MNCLLTLSRGNSDPERGFSINKNQLDLHGSNIGENTLEALRIVKDYLMRNGGIGNFVVTKDLVDKCDKAHSQYQAYLAAAKKQEMRELEMIVGEKEKGEKMDKVMQLERDIAVLSNGVALAENLMKERK